MINHLSGTLFERGKDFVVLECAGIGFKVLVTSATLNDLVDEDSCVTILTHLQMRDGGAELFGFSSEEEREIFHALTGVAGVGPKSGMSILSVLGGNGVIGGALRGDAKLFASVPGIGKKLAQRMVAELPDRLTKLNAKLSARGGQVQGDVSGGHGNGISDAVEALVSLGFPRPDAHNAVLQVAKAGINAADAEQLIKNSLAHLSSNSRAARP